MAKIHKLASCDLQNTAQNNAIISEMHFFLNRDMSKIIALAWKVSNKAICEIKTRFLTQTH